MAKKKYYRKKRYYKKKGRPTNKQLKFVTKYVSRLVRSEEHKYKEIANQSLTIDDTSSHILLNPLNIGTSRNEIIGEKYLVESIRIRGYIDNTNAQAVDGCMKLYIVHVTDNDGSDYQVADHLDTSSGDLINCFPNPDRKHNYKILWSTKLSYDVDAHQYIPLDIVLKNISIPVQVNATGATATQIEQGAIFLVGMSLEATYPPHYNFNARCYYKDN